MRWGTRRKLRHGTPVSWLSGAAGGGKTVIQREIVDQCKAKGIFGGAFFFSTRSTVTKLDSLVATLACQLANRSKKLRTYIEDALANDSALLDKSLEVQFDQLIRVPIMRYSYDSTGHKPPSTSGILWPAHIWWKCYVMRMEWFIFVIDGLDECDDPKEQLQLLRLIEWFTRDEYLPIRFSIASRPEYDIRSQFNEPSLRSLTYQVKLDDYESGDGDIRTYLLDELSRIRRTHPGKAGFPRDWPSPEDVERLVERASKQFIYPGTVIKFVNNRQNSPVALLKLVLDLPHSPESSNPLADLDELYSTILSHAEVDLPSLRTVLHLIMVHPQDYSSTTDIDTYLFFEPGNTGLLLADLHSLVHIPDSPPTTEFRDEYVHFYHKSLEDFLTTKHRSGTLYQSKDGTRSMLSNLNSAAANILRLALERAVIGEAGTGSHLVEDTSPYSENEKKWLEIALDLGMHSQKPAALAREVINLSRPTGLVSGRRIDCFYCAILRCARVDPSQLKQVLFTLRDDSARYTSLLEVDAVLGFGPGVSERLLKDLHSLVYVPVHPPPIDDVDRFVRLRRDDFRDFLSDPNRMSNNDPNFFE